MSADNVLAPINAPPYGLLELLSTKALGQNPNELLQGVRPTVDLQRMWAQGAPVQVASFGGLCSVVGPQSGAGLYVEVPQGEVWIPLSLYMTATPAGAGDTGRATPMIFQQVGALSIPLELGPISQTSATGATSLSATSWNFIENCTPRAWPQGTRFGIFCPLVTVAVTGIQVAATLRYVSGN